MFPKYNIDIDPNSDKEVGIPHGAFDFFWQFYIFCDIFISLLEIIFAC